MHRIHAAGLQEDRQLMRTAEGLQRCQILGTQRLEVAEHQGDGGIPGDELHLRDRLARLQRFNQRRQRGNAHAHLRDRGMALDQIGHEARIQLAEADQGLVLLLYPAYRQATLAAVTPGRVHQRCQHGFRAHPGVAELRQQPVLLDQDLLAAVQVLQHAAATHAKMGTARLYPMRRGL